MLNLLNFLWRNYAFFLFLLLEFIAVSMVVSNGHQSAIFAYTSNQLGGQALGSWDSFIYYFSLKETNEQLVAENNQLRTKLNQSHLDRDALIFDSIILPDTLNAQDSLRLFQLDSLKVSFDYTAAKVVSNSTHKQKNYLMLNKGRQQGVKENMGVIGPQGLVGIVQNVSNDFCTAVSLININSRISAKLLNSNELGTINWDGKDDNIAQLNSIETYIPIHVGDSVVSSGFSHIFPEGILIGVIQDYYKIEGGNTYYISVSLSTQFSQLQFVSIARNIFHEEQTLLKRKMEEDK